MTNYKTLFQSNIKFKRDGTDRDILPDIVRKSFPEGTEDDYLQKHRRNKQFHHENKTQHK